ncbi:MULTISPECIES: TIM barrel protein [unclassified Pseudomonas]|uniref:hydroxypyruvate isomerase family protein n=1 Tax=unclassified Pseudomonas TaxID=196821 RepID=UPI0024486F08|nr:MULTISPECIES: TIM barrel protein [unclassified Pseudomonas]MDG9928867.1 TIM barrel protein [Pseudomonas sp. GD04042]MDH0484317.1 TIM barrel protein [Pseudomonas sp. GD04015]MDH0604193.1 TIM barrel protein [Pseudomonas sp. GD03869]
MKIAANLSLLFGELPLLQRPQAAAAAGFDGVEIQFPYEVSATSLREVLERSSMPLVLVNLPAGDLMAGGAGLAAVPERQAQFDAALREALDYAAVVRPQCVNVLPGRLAEGVPREQALATLEANLREAAERFQALGIRVLCEAINPLDMPGFLINTAEQLDELLRRVDHPNCQAQLDLYHMARQGLDVAACIERLAGRTGHVQFADCPGRGAPGTGELAFVPLLEVLEATGYQGWLGAEYSPGGDTSASLAWLAGWRG